MQFAKISVLGRSFGQGLGKLRAPQWVSISLILVTVMSAVVLGWLLLDTALDKQTALWGKAFIFGLGALAALATALVSWQPGDCSFSDRVASPFGAGIVLIAVFTAFGTMTDALSLFEPRAATTRDLEPIIDTTTETRDLVRAMSGQDDAAALAKLEGRWGESRQCNVAYDVAVEGDLVTLERVAGSGLPDFKMAGTVKGQEDGRVSLSVELPESAYGQSLDLVLTGSGVGERLSWIEGGRDVAQDYFRCGGESE